MCVYKARSDLLFQQGSGGGIIEAGVSFSDVSVTIYYFYQILF